MYQVHHKSIRNDGKCILSTLLFKYATIQALVKNVKYVPAWPLSRPDTRIVEDVTAVSLLSL